MCLFICVPCIDSSCCLSHLKPVALSRAVPAPSDALALVLLCIQRGSPEQAIAVLDSLSPSCLANILSNNPSLLLEQQYPALSKTLPSKSVRGSSPKPSQKLSDNSPMYNKKGNSSSMKSVSSGRENAHSFSELASVLMDSKPAVLADVLADLVTVLQFATLQEILQVIHCYRIVNFRKPKLLNFAVWDLRSTLWGRCICYVS